MARKRYKPEEIVAKLRQVDVLVSQGQHMMDAIRQVESSRPARGAGEIQAGSHTREIPRRHSHVSSRRPDCVAGHVRWGIGAGRRG
jgi:hypothetical protein